MKPLYSLLLAAWLLLGFAPTGYAWPPVEATFGTERGQPFSLQLDGQLVTRLATQPVHLNQLAPGRHWVEMTLVGPRRGPRVAANVWLEPGLATSFTLTERPGYNWRLRQTGTAALDDYGYEGQGQTYSQPPVDEAPSAGSYPPVPSAGSYPPAPADNYPPSGSYPPAPGAGYPGPVGPAPPYPGSAAYPGPAAALLPLSPAETAELVQALRAATFDDRRLPMVQQALAHCYLQSDQLAALVRTMAFDSSQQRVAVLGYSHLADPQNFHRVLSALTFPTSASAVLDKLGLAQY